MPRDKQPPRRTVTEDCFASVVELYLNSPKFKGYAANTRELWGRELRFAMRADLLGAVSLQAIRPSLVQAYLDGLDGRPGKQAAAYSALKAVEKWAIVRDLLPRTIMTGVETERPEGGHTPWTAEHVETAERHARPDLARFVTLAANTGQRRSDLVRLGWTDVETYQGVDGIRLTQQKTGKDVWVPITSPLAAAMKTWERRPGPFLLRPDGAQWVGKQIYSAWIYERDTNPALAALSVAGLVPHGLRGHACVMLLRGGANTRQISDMVGMSEEMVARYTRFSLQRDNASAAVYHLERTLRERQNDMSNKKHK